MGMAKVEKVNLPEPYKLENFTKKILVIGGGITGMSAAMDAAKAGYEVTIVEKEAQLGGYAAKMRKQLPVGEPYESLISPVIADKIHERRSLLQYHGKNGHDRRPYCRTARRFYGHFEKTRRKHGI